MMRRMRRRLGLLLVALAVAAPTYANPVIPGDYPDPTVVRADGAFYASATTSGWAPVFPVLRSPDLVNWTRVGAVLPSPPRWATGTFWAPALTHERGRYLAYWGAARADGRPCIALSTAPRAEGPWTYRGRVTCPPSGAIDASTFRDGDGSLWLLWKAMGWGRGIYAQRLSADGLHVAGASQLLIQPDADWEQGVTEGPSVVFAGGHYLLFYAGGHCCRVPCSYGEGVAQADHLVGPYVKNPANPVLATGGAWKCPGHGTVLGTGRGALAFVHHAYRADDVFDLRRQVLLDPVSFGPDGWPVIGDGGAPLVSGPSPLDAVQQPAPTGFSERFGTALGPGWEWLFDAAPALDFSHGGLTERCTGPLTFVARQLASDRLTATTTIDPPAGDAAVGLGVNLGRGVRGIEVRHGRARAFVASPEGVATGPSIAAPVHQPIRLVLGLAPDGELAVYAGWGARPLTRLDAGPAAKGSRPTRVALTCRGRGSGRFAFARVRAG
jgi:hypothetical protein